MSKKFNHIQKDEFTQIKFDDIAGLDIIISELNELVNFLKTPNKVIQLGARIPKGILLEGPPGTGKTWLAKRLGMALIGEAVQEPQLRSVQFHPNLSYV